MTGCQRYAVQFRHSESVNLTASGCLGAGDPISPREVQESPGFEPAISRPKQTVNPKMWSGNAAESRMISERVKLCRDLFKSQSAFDFPAV